MICSIFSFLKKGEDIIYNGASAKALLIDSTSVINYQDDKEIITDFPVKTGDMLQYQGYNWFIIGQVDKHEYLKTY